MQFVNPSEQIWAARQICRSGCRLLNSSRQQSSRPPIKSALRWAYSLHSGPHLHHHSTVRFSPGHFNLIVPIRVFICCAAVCLLGGRPATSFVAAGVALFERKNHSIFRLWLPLGTLSTPSWSKDTRHGRPEFYICNKQQNDWTFNTGDGRFRILSFGPGISHSRQ